MSKEQQITSQNIEEMMKFPLGILVVVVKDTFEQLEAGAKDEDGEEFKKHLQRLSSANEKIVAKIQDDSFWKEDDDMEQALVLCDSFTEEERSEVLFALNCFMNDLDEAMQHSRGKILKKQEQAYDSVQELFCEIRDNFRTFSTERPFYDSLKICLNKLIEMYSDDDLANSEEDEEWFREALSSSKTILKKLEECDPAKPFDENLFSLYNDLNENLQDFFQDELLDFGTDFLTEKLSDLQSEYADLDVDLSANEENLAAIKQIQRKMKKMQK